MATFEIRDMTFTYPERNAPALKNVNIDIKQGEFIAICGKSGCGKTTLLRNFKTALMPHGTRNGEIIIDGVPLVDVSERDQAERIGYVMQDPDNQIVTDKVWHELAFGLENMGYDNKTIRIRVSEMASFFGIQTWFDKKTNQLSGGQKQLLNLAAIMAMQPEVLVLDEPTSQLDPIAASDFLNTVAKINDELGTTVIITEHRLEEVLPAADRAIVIDEGEIIIDDTPENASAVLAEKKHDMFIAMPAPIQIYGALWQQNIGKEFPCPLDVGEGRRWLSALMENVQLKKNHIAEEKKDEKANAETVIKMKEVWFRYSKGDKDVIKDLSVEIEKGEMFAIVGGNGTGKTTALSLMSGMNKPYRGTIWIDGKKTEAYKTNEMFSGVMGVLPQDPQTLFVENTVEKDLKEILSGTKLTKEEKNEMIRQTADMVEIGDLLGSHPYDLSGGEQQRAALAKVLLTEPDILLLDEPTKGIDNYFKIKLAKILSDLKEEGITIVMVSHDIEFCGKYADRCAMFFDGSITTVDGPRKFFSGNSFYTTAANRMARHIFKNAVIVDDVIELCEYNLTGSSNIGSGRDGGSKKTSGRPNTKYPDAEIRRVDIKPQEKTKIRKTALDKKTVSIATMTAAAILMAATLFISLRWDNSQSYLLTSMLIIIYIMIPFFIIYERRKPHAREVVVIAVMVALGVAGRGIFFMVPQFKPTVALVIIAGLALGSQAGFLTGALTAFVSNCFFGQGAWTPWQMFALGIIGCIAGLLAESILKKKKVIPVTIFGVLAAFFIYGGIVDLWTIFAFTPEPNLGTALVVYGRALPFDLILAISTGIFLVLLMRPMVEKIERVKIKYGLLEEGTLVK
ncbi:MAG: energy-coupling factor transporter ATPase [Eubacteriaceae bacterium]|nr:energy-coupling factor transporter ATPase [Eubacteriaceae bacterium]